VVDLMIAAAAQTTMGHCLWPDNLQWTHNIVLMATCGERSVIPYTDIATANASHSPFHVDTVPCLYYFFN